MGEWPCDGSLTLRYKVEICGKWWWFSALRKGGALNCRAAQSGVVCCSIQWMTRVGLVVAGRSRGPGGTAIDQWHLLKPLDKWHLLKARDRWYLLEPRDRWHLLKPLVEADRRFHGSCLSFRWVALCSKKPSIAGRLGVGACARVASRIEGRCSGPAARPIHRASAKCYPCILTSLSTPLDAGVAAFDACEDF
jgi:hypothetical protein